MLNRKSRRALKAKGVKMSQSVEQIQKSYGELCAKAGELQYNAKQIELQITEINQRLMLLNKEYHELNAKAQQEQAAKVVPIAKQVEAPKPAKEKKDASKKS